MVTPLEYRNAMGRFATGVTVITARHGDTEIGMTANAVTSVSLDPPQLLICVDHHRAIHPLLIESGQFVVNILSDDQEGVSRYFARQASAPESVSLTPRDGRPPVIPGALASLDCTVVERFDGGDHTIFLARVDGVEQSEGNPLLYFKGQYRRIANN